MDKLISLLVVQAALELNDSNWKLYWNERNALIYELFDHLETEQPRNNYLYQLEA